MSRSVEQNQRMRDERRELILSHALRLFAANGLAATKITEIAASAQMSQGLLYHYFRSKGEIFTAIMRGAFEKMNAAARALEDLPLTAREKVCLAIGELLRGINESEDFAAAVLLIAQAGISDATPAEARAIIRAESGIPYAVMTRIMREGQQEGTIKVFDAEELAMVFWTTIKGLALHKAVCGSEFKAPDVRILTGIFLTGDAQGEDNG